jgi:DNA-binding MarR family transcriptional regulator
VATLSDGEFANLLAFRTELRRFDHWSEQQAKRVGLTHMQHQLLLAIRGHGDPRGPTIGDLADYLQLRHHSAVELANRVEAGGWAERQRDAKDARVVRLTLTDKGRGVIEALEELHVAELARLTPMLDRVAAADGAAASAAAAL